MGIGAKKLCLQSLRQIKTQARSLDYKDILKFGNF